MRHISLDESFWRSAIQALVSGESIEDVEPSLLDVSRLLHHFQESTNESAAGRLGILTLGGTEEERALGLTLAALLARRGRRVLIADCDFSDQTWSRLLGAEESDGIADHVGYGTPPRRLVRRTSWEGLALLPSGTTALDPAGILRSDKVPSCLDAAGRDYDLVCVGLPFDEMLAWGRGAVAGMDRAILVGPAGEELAFELAIPRLVRRLELLTTLDVPPLGRWRPALGAALPALVQTAIGAGSDARQALPSVWAPPPIEGVENGGPAAEPSCEPAVTTQADGGLVTSRVPLPPISAELRHPPESPGPAAEPALSEAESAAAGGADRESAADVAFLESLPRGDARERGPEATLPAPRSAPPPTPPLVHPRLRAVALQQQLELTPSASELEPEADLRELAESWRVGSEARERAAAEPVDEDAGRSVLLTALAVLLCLALGAGGFWFWRAGQQTPDGQFTFVDSAEQGVNDRAGRETAGDGATAAEAATPTPIGGSEETAGDTEARPQPATDGPVLVSAAGAAAPAAPEGTAASASEKSGASAGIGADAGAGEGPPAEAEAAAGVTAPGTPVRTADGIETAAPAVTYAPPASGPLLAYSLHVGSYQTFDAAQRAALALRARGLAAFVAPVLLEGKGEWHRVFVDALPDAPASQQNLARARQAGAVSEGAVRETPWALYLGTFATRDLAQELIARLARSGVSGYAVGAGPVHVYAGAFEAAGDAEILNRQLRDRGFESALVRRRGVETR